MVGQATAANVIALINNAAGTGVFTVGPIRSVAGTVSDVALTDAQSVSSLAPTSPQERGRETS